MQIAESDGLIPVKRGLRQQEHHCGDFIRATSRKSSASNRYRELTVADLLEIDGEIQSIGGGHPLLMRQVEPKLEVSSLADFPVLSPSGQGRLAVCPLFLHPRSVLKLKLRILRLHPCLIFPLWARNETHQRTTRAGDFSTLEGSG